MFFSIDVELIPGVLRASGRVPTAPQHKQMMKILSFIKDIKNRLEAMHRLLFLLRI